MWLEWENKSKTIERIEKNQLTASSQTKLTNWKIGGIDKNSDILETKKFSIVQALWQTCTVHVININDLKFSLSLSPSQSLSLSLPHPHYSNRFLFLSDLFENYKNSGWLRAAQNVIDL